MIRILFVAVVFLSGMPLFSSMASADTLQQIKDSGVIRIGYRDSAPPMSFVDKNGKPVGYSIDLCTRIASEVKQQLGDPNIRTEFVRVSAEDRFQALQNYSIDILCGVTTMTISRMKQVDFTQYTFVTGGSLLSMSGKEVANVSDLSGKKVAVGADTTTIAALQAALKETLTEAEVVPVASAAEGFAALKEGKVDAFAADQIVLIGLILNSEDTSKFVISGELFSFEPFAFAVRRNDADFRLVANQVLAQLFRSGQIGLIYNTWFSAIGARTPPLLRALYQLGATPE